MQSYINNIESINNNKKLIYILKKKNINYTFNDNFIKLTIDKNDFILHHENFIPQFILYESSNIDFQRICENININIDNYETSEDIIYEIYKIINQPQIINNKSKNILEKENINIFNKKLEEKKETYIQKELNDNINLYSNKKISPNFSTRACVEMYGDQIIKIFSNNKFNVNIDSFPDIKITMSGFTFIGSDNLIININMKINLNMLNQPPSIFLSSNKILKDNILQVICQLKPFSDINSWSIKYSIYDSIINIFNMIDKFGETKQEFSTQIDEIINNLEYLLSIKNQNISETKLLELFDKDLLIPNLNNSKIKNEYWKKGTGYGHGGVNEWNIDEYIKNVNNKKKSIAIEYEKLFNIFISINIDDKINIEQILTLLLNYIQNEEILNDNIIIIANIISKNYYIFNKSQYEKKYINLLNLVKEYFNENNIEHILTEDKNISQLVEKTIINGNLHTDPFIKLFNEYKFKMFPEEFNKFHYSNNIVNLNSEQILRLKKEFNICKKSISINCDASLFFYVQRDKINKMKFIISGPKDTPYEQGLYIFDMTITNEFPTKPPLVIFLNHGSQRFNPNLYNCGKVCLSLLGTWRGDIGESWNSSTSTLFQILVSIQSQILIDEPYFNEPGYEKYIGKPIGLTNSKNYNYNIRQYNLDYAINGLISNILSSNNSYPEFTDIIKNYFKFKKNKILEVLDKWENDLKTDTDTNIKDNILDKWFIKNDLKTDTNVKNNILDKFLSSKNNFIELVNKL